MTRHRRPTDPPPVEPATETPGIVAAKEAQARARQGFLDAVETGQQTRAVTERMADILHRNHFGPLISEVFRR